MIRKSKSVITVIILALICAAAFGAAAWFLRTPQKTEFAGDGYFLQAREKDDAENRTVSEQIWFSKGSNFKEEQDSVTFTDTEGAKKSVPNDSFIYYQDGSLSAVKSSSVMSLDDYSAGLIQYYTMDKGTRLYGSNGQYTLGEGEEQVSFHNYLLKSSNTRYLLGSAEIVLIMADSSSSAVIDSGHAELEYLEDDRSVARIQDGTNVWQFLTAGTRLDLSNNVSLDLATGELLKSIPGDGSEEAVSDSGHFYIGDINTDLTSDIQAEIKNGKSFSYPTYRFTVVNGEDGEDGEDGQAGEGGSTGAEGSTGEKGADGVSNTTVNSGQQGAAGHAGGTAISGQSGGQTSDLQVNTQIPVVMLKDWVVSGKALKYTLYMDEISAASVNEGTTRISLVDTDTGEEVYYWDGEGDTGDTGQKIDLSMESEEGYTLYCNALKPGHHYRFTVYAGYTLNEVTGTQAILSRTFTADDYGISFDLLERTSGKAKFALRQNNKNVVVAEDQDIEVYVDDEYVGTMLPSEYEEYELALGKKRSNQTYKVTFKVPISITSYNEETDEMVKTVLPEPVEYTYEITTLREVPEVGGVRLTAYDSGYYMAEALGMADGDTYKTLKDEDDAIEEITFELYDYPVYNENFLSWSKEKQEAHKVAEQTVKSGTIAYFKIEDKSENPQAAVKTGTRYYLKASYTYNDGEKVITSPILESATGRKSPNYTPTGSINPGIPEITHEQHKEAWDTGYLDSLSKTVLSFIGDEKTYNTTADRDIDRDKGITFNAIKGTIQAVVNDINSKNFISTEYPVELQISAEPDYYKSIFYTSTTANGTLGTAETSEPAQLPNGIYMPIDLDGLKADTSYMITMYGYEASSVDEANRPTGLHRVIMGSTSIHTSASKEMKISLKHGPTMDLGCYLVLGDESAETYYDIGSSTYADGYQLNTDNVYKGLASITFELYKEKSAEPIGTCTITNTTSRNKAQYSSLYEEFYAGNAEETLNRYQNSGYKGIIGVGSDDYVYTFKNSSGEEIQSSMLTNGKYRIDVKCAYDYTDTRYDAYMNAQTDEERLLYSYYTYRADRKEYINSMVINGGVTATTGWFEYTALPYIVPGAELQYSDGNYISVTELKNSDLGAYNGDQEQNDLYCDLWEADTVAGLKLTSKYKNNSDLTTATFDYYGFDYDAWKKASNEGDKLIQYNNYGFRCSIEMKENSYLEVPEVWLLFYDADSLPSVETAFESVKGDGYNYMTTTTVNGKPVYIYYMDKKFFSRGHSYMFAYNAELPDYTYKTSSGFTKTGFHYPESYYSDIRRTPYVYANSLKSGAVSVNRQKPKVYSTLEHTDQRPLATDKDNGTDYWKVYVDDPDGGVIWKTLLGAASSNVQEGNANKGGIYDIFGVKLEPVRTEIMDDGSAKDICLTIRFLEQENSPVGSSIAIATDSVYQEDETQLQDGQISDKQLETVQKYLERVVRDPDGVITDRGGYVRVNNMRDMGDTYKAVLRYSIQDDEGAQEGSLNLVQHSYIGYREYSDPKEQLQMKIDSVSADQNTMYIRLGAPKSNTEVDPTNDDGSNDYYRTQDYLDRARVIAAVKVEAFNSTRKEWIKERDGQGKPGKEKKALWLAPEAPASTAADYRYSLKFKLSDLDQNDTGALQYEPGDKLQFQFTVYYATGNGGNTGESYTTDNGYVVKYLNQYSKDPKINEDLLQTYSYTYLIPSGAIVSQGNGAGKSLFNVKTTYEKLGTLPWTQKMSVKSTTFEPVGFADKQVAGGVKLVDNIGYQNNTVLEALKVDTYTVEHSGTTEMTVQSALPTMESLDAVGGITRVQLKGKVDNWNLVEYPGDEKLHLYYLVYEYTLNGQNAEKGDLKAAMIGEPENAGLIDNAGNLKVSFQLEKQQKYWIEIYYKTKDGGLDTDLFQGLGTGTQLAGEAAEKVANIVTTNTSFGKISGIPNNRILIGTGEGIVMSDVSLKLGNTQEYRNKQMIASADISTEILEEEKDSMAVFYRLERCEESEYDEVSGTVDKSSAWKTVIADNREPGVVNWDSSITNPDDKDGTAYWQYYNKALLTDPAAATKGRNRLTMNYYAGGVIRPGYVYRISARVFQEDNGTWEMISKETGSDQGFTYSTPTVWNKLKYNLDKNIMLQISNVSRSSTKLKVSYRVRDLNNTSLDEKYFVRLAEQKNGEWKILDGSEDSVHYKKVGVQNWQTKAFDMGSSYSAEFTDLTPNTTYKLIFYALIDADFDNHVDVVETGDRLKIPGKNLLTTTDGEVMDLTYFTDASQSKIQDNYSQLYQKFFGISSPSATTGMKAENDSAYATVIGYTDDYVMRSPDAECSVGDQYGIVVSNNELTLKFTGAFGLDNISRIEYRLYHATDTSIDYSSMVEKPDTVKSLFDAVGVSGFGTDGDVMLTLKPGQTLSAPGVYYIIIRFESRTEDGSYKTVESHTYMFNKKD